jgi:hypothetical protein
MLQSCLGVFQSLEHEFRKLEEVTGQELKTTDFDYLTNMTKAKIDNLNTELNKQADLLKKVYTQYGRPEELNRIILAQSNMNKLVDDATTTYTKITATNDTKKNRGKPNQERLPDVVVPQPQLVAEVPSGGSRRVGKNSKTPQKRRKVSNKKKSM